MASSPNESERNHSPLDAPSRPLKWISMTLKIPLRPILFLSRCPIACICFKLLSSFSDLELRNSSASTASPSVTSAAGSAGSGTSASGPDDFDAFYRHRGRSPARKTLDALTKVWYTWLPPKAIDSFQKGTFVIHDLMRAKEMMNVVLRKEKNTVKMRRTLRDGGDPKYSYSNIYFLLIRWFFFFQEIFPICFPFGRLCSMR